MAEASTSEGERARARFRDATSEVQTIRARAAELVADVTAAPGYKDSVGDTPKPDVNYVFPTFVTTKLAARARRV